MTEIRMLVGTTDFEHSGSFYGGGVIEIFEDSPHHPFEPPAGVKIAIEVDDAAEPYRRLATADVEIVDQIGERPRGHRRFEIHDPSGLHLVFFSPSYGTGHPAGEG